MDALPLMRTAALGGGAESRAQFAGLVIAGDPSFEEHLNRYDVVQLNVQNFLADSDGIDDMLDYIADTVIKELSRAYPDFEMPRRGGLPRALAEINAETGTSFVFIIDE